MQGSGPRRLAVHHEGFPGGRSSRHHVVPEAWTMKDARSKINAKERESGNQARRIRVHAKRMVCEQREKSK